tara:strand:- start:237 stop:1265 length:1029 start_codon:yes stop_codon:yes gene_type:complete
MFKNSNSYLRFQIENGMRLACFGSLSVYEQRGQVQFVTKKIELSGVGTLHQAFEALKNKLEKEGLFDLEHKLGLKEIPKKVGILTSSEGAAIEDVLHVLARRSPFLEIVFRPSKVQGEDAAKNLSDGLNELSSIKGIDTIIICRGGGSIEDLWAFNEEILAQAIFNCKVPIISAVGHETDFTISDFVADQRAATPTEAAEIVCLSSEQIFRSFENYETFFTNKVESLSLLNKNKFDNLLNGLMRVEPLNKIKTKKIVLDNFKNFFLNYIEKAIDRRKIKFESMSNQLISISPDNVLSRGFSIAIDKKSNKIVRSANDLSIDDNFILKTSGGNLEAKKIKQLR